MVDGNLCRALMVSQGSFMPIFQRSVLLLLFIIIVWTVLSQFGWYKRLLSKLKKKLFSNNS